MASIEEVLKARDEHYKKRVNGLIMGAPMQDSHICTQIPFVKKDVLPVPGFLRRKRI